MHKVINNFAQAARKGCQNILAWLCSDLARPPPAPSCTDKEPSQSHACISGTACPGHCCPMSSQHLVGRLWDGRGTFPQLWGLPEMASIPLLPWQSGLQNSPCTYTESRLVLPPVALAMPVPDCSGRRDGSRRRFIREGGVSAFLSSAGSSRKAIVAVFPATHCLTDL